MSGTDGETPVAVPLEQSAGKNADLKSYFDTIPKDRLLALVAGKVSDRRVLALLGAFLEQQVREGGQQWTPEQGTPQGAVIGPLLANLYLHPLDLLMQQSGREMVRYADDFVVLCHSRAEAEEVLRAIEQWMSAAGLQLHPEKTRLVDLNEAKAGFDFLGYHFRRGGKRWPRKKSVQKLKEKLRSKTHRNNGQSVRAIITDVNLSTRGWYEYFRHSIVTGFCDIDRWIRGRLRSILRKRQGRRGRGRGNDHHRWPDLYFARHGLFSLHAARLAAIQSHR